MFFVIKALFVSNLKITPEYKFLNLIIELFCNEK